MSCSVQTVEEYECALRALIEVQRDRCLWFMESDYYPNSEDAILRVLNNIQRHGDLEAFKQAGILIQWLASQPSK